MIERLHYTTIKERTFQGKVILLLGPRQVGKTTVVRAVAQAIDIDYLYLNADEPDVPQLLSGKSSTELKALIGDRKLVLLDEAQRIEDIGLRLKLLVDRYPEIQLLVTGSSSLELSNRAQEPLTGRKFEYQLYPLCYAELEQHFGVLETNRLVEDRLLYGGYPEIVTAPGEQRIERLKTLASSYLYKDILALQDVRKPELLARLLQALAFQIGSQVSYQELSRLLRVDNQTIERYVDLLEKAFVIFRLGSFSRNLRTELKRSKKIFFWDTGIRNALISNFQPMALRQDKEALWENYLVAERLKINHYQKRYANTYFWRTHAQQELDYLEERDGRLYAFEFTWNPKKKKRIPASFLTGYPGAVTQVVDRENFRDFLRP